MIYAAPSTSFEATLSGAPTGLVGTLGVRIMDGVGGTTVARTTSGIVETPAGSGVYVATLIAPSSTGQYQVVWDTGTLGPTTTTAEDLTVTSSVPTAIVGTGWKPDYTTLAQLKAALRITDTDDDPMLQIAITASSRAIDAHCNRQFGLLAVPTARYYTPRPEEVRPSRLHGSLTGGYWHRYVVDIDDLMTSTGLVVKTDPDGDGNFDTTLVLDTDFRLAPWNANADGRPWTRLVPILGPVGFTGLWFPNLERSVQITAQWGWSAIPNEVQQACILQAARLFTRRLAPFGIAGSPDIGTQMRLLAKLDADVEVMLAGVCRYSELVW